MPAPNSIIGRILGGYVIQSQIGSGGMGVVFRAHDDRLGRTVAIKILPAKFRTDETLKQRFLREGRTAARIDHPNVARILSAGEEGELPYLVMEYVDGGSLQRLLEKKIRLPATRAVKIARQVAEALAAAHKVGVLHRDVKPANVLFTKEGDAKLVDFGLAREEMSDVSLSQTGMVMGTPHYMAPEVCEGKKADARSDVYALGVVLYAMIALRLPFDADTAIAILMAHIQKPVPPIPEAPRGVAAVLMKSLAKSPAKRWSSAAEFAEALARVEVAPGESLAAVEAVTAPEPPPVPSQGAAAASSPIAPSRTAGAPSVPLGITPTGATVPGGLLPTDATPTGGVVARRRIPAAAWAAGGLAAALLVGGGIFFAMRGRGSAAPPPVTGAAPPLPGPADSPGSGAWDAALASALATAANLESKDEFRRAVELLASLQPPDALASATVAREKKEILRRAELRAARETSAVHRGAAAALQLRDLAKKLPEETAKPLLDLAEAAERDWLPRDGFAGLRGLFATRDFRVVIDALQRVEPPTRPEEKETLLGARRAAERLKALIDAAGRWFNLNTGKDVVVRRTDGSTIAGTIRGVVEAAILIGTRDGRGQVSVGVREIAMSEFAARALDGCPADDLVLAAVDALLLGGEPGEAWPVALQARRRGLTLEPDREKMLREQIPPDKRKAASDLLLRVEKERRNPKAAAPLTREWLRLFDALPLNSRMAEDAREAMRVAGGPATAEDARLYLAATVAEAGEALSLRYDSADAILADFHPVARARIQPGSLPALASGPGGSCLVLRGLHWTDVAIEAEVRPEGVFLLMAGWRSVFEQLSAGVMPGEKNSVLVRPPIPSKGFHVPKDPEGWIRMSVSLSGGRLKLKVGAEVFECDIPDTWTGEIGLWFKDAVEFRSLEIRGRARFQEPDMDEEFKPLDRAMKGQRKEVAASWRDWVDGAGEKNKAVVQGGVEWKWLRPPSWNAGDNYRVRFKFNAGDAAELMIGLRATESRREVLLSDESVNGFLGDDKFLHCGKGLPLPRNEWVQVDIQVYGDLAAIQMGRSIWYGHMDPLKEGGMEIGVRGGTVMLGDLKIEALEK